MEYTQDLTLIKLTTAQDSIGQPVNTKSSREVLAKESYVRTNEFYNAMAVGLRPTAELQIRKLDYDNEQQVEYKGIRYDVIRTLPKGQFDIVLIIGIKQGVNGN